MGSTTTISHAVRSLVKVLDEEEERGRRVVYWRITHGPGLSSERHLASNWGLSWGLKVKILLAATKMSSCNEVRLSALAAPPFTHVRILRRIQSLHYGSSEACEDVQVMPSYSKRTLCSDSQRNIADCTLVSLLVQRLRQALSDIPNAHAKSKLLSFNLSSSNCFCCHHFCSL